LDLAVLKFGKGLPFKAALRLEIAFVRKDWTEMRAKRWPGHDSRHSKRVWRGISKPFLDTLVKLFD
jgi:hypothetical protein